MLNRQNNRCPIQGHLAFHGKTPSKQKIFLNTGFISVAKQALLKSTCINHKMSQF